ncbi:formyltetrahydrofolate deformylase [Flavobacteriaceae bacterium]|nr:formyltetrahydrofolate deformylase [Flavobacteriaceae bacterium]MDA9015322.1 formyltetrahydrofolate deformylase [Flavobacteriaceae bacterium]MDA9572332.1 formyltetrahydrofolate deformylase [Flavobacteriaceae bacterium]MDC3354064.1 formyltetrahydrofolate deformylase [Flavobacteriaceae bacterium]
MRRLILLMHCPDKKGIIAAVTNFIHQRNGNIVYIDQYVDRIQGAFFMRIEVEGNFDLSNFERFKTNFENELGNPFQMSCSFYLADILPKMAVFVSKYDHCLYDILAQQSSGKLACEIPFITSNHKDLEPIAKQFNIPFYHIPVTKDTKEVAEQKQLDLLKKYEIDCVVLARYMQIISSRIIDVYSSKIINIHHSFLPAFPGAKPYHSAFQRGVKIIGATSHYVTEELDAGPIIEQDTIRVSHGHEVKDFILKGQDLERIVLLRALKLHCERKIMTYNNKTIVFN